MKIKEIMNKKPKLTWVVLVLLIAAGTAGYFLREDPTMKQYKSVARHILSTHHASDQPAGILSACGTPDCKEVVSAALEKEGQSEETGKKEEIYTMFQADEHGNLVLNETTRLNIEKLYALNTPEELDEKMKKLSSVLPDAAHRQVANLIDYFDKYTREIQEIYPPDVAPETVEEILVQLKVMHDLRKMHFGADVARAFYADEEKMSLQLIYLMAIEKDKSLSLGEKAERAQQLLKNSPELAAAYDPDRK
ncbi:MAG TPA: lipase secretion chaperone [Smithellaceae bacterium]|nr:lipase secretion chaperone [Smithellaceae bacterium]HRS90293.1 lipase secretion chaperone [Smithellaceae bacterium]